MSRSLNYFRIADLTPCVAFLTNSRTVRYQAEGQHTLTRPGHTHLVGWQKAEVEGRVGDDVSLGALSAAGHHLVPEPRGKQIVPIRES